MTLRSDTAAGLVFILLGILVFAIGTDLPFGNLSTPGAGMMPKLMALLMMGFAIVVMFGDDSAPLGSLDWSDVWHALQLVAITAAATMLYRHLGFIVTMVLLVFSLLVAVERRGLLPAAAYSIGLTLFAYWLFGKALKAPLERGLIWF
jgi:hypothetical protein